MTTITGSGATALRARFGPALASRLEQHIERLSWDPQRLAGHQRERLRALLASALTRSPFHARRLAGIDPARFELSDLAGLPVISKQQMMASFDELLTDRRLTRARADQQLTASAHEPGLLYDQYVCLASGGSSGLRGVFVQTVDEYADFAASVLRRAMARVSAAGGPPRGGLPVAIVAAASPVHSSGFAAAVARGYPVRMIAVPATLPTGEIVRRLNQAQPPALLAHASTLVLLAGEQHAGRLRISPQTITAMSELLTDKDRLAIGDAYELTDHFTRHPAASGPYLHATIQGRADETFRYGTLTVDPLVIRTVMVRTPNAVEYQVRQTSRGIDVAVVAAGALDLAELASSLEQSLGTAGLPDPCVHVHKVAEITRHPQTGKTRRFVAL